MWCRDCNLETNEKICPVCGHITEEDIPTEIMWCFNCKTPIIRAVNDRSKEVCPLCGEKTKHIAVDLRPVFPEERILLSLLLNEQADTYMHKSVWAANNRYYVNGKSISFSSDYLAHADTDIINEKLPECSKSIDYSLFDRQT